jgi:hypothetical protein
MEWLVELLADVLTEAIPAMRERRRERKGGGGTGLVSGPQSSSRHDTDLDTFDYRGRRL